MKTFLNDIKLIEHYLQDALPIEERLLVEARILTDFEFKRNVFLQKKIYQLVNLYKNRKLKKEAMRYYENLFNDPMKSSFSESIIQIFKN